MTKKSIIVGLCVILLSAAVSTPVEAQRDRRDAPRQKCDRTERIEKGERGQREKEVVMTKQELAMLINAIVTAAEEDEMSNACPQQRDITITSNKDRDLLYLLLQYHNLNAMKATPVYTQPGQPINVGGQLYYPAGSNLVVAQGAQGMNDADKVKALEEELARLKAAQQNPQRDDDQIAQQLAALRSQLNELEKASEKAPVYNYDNRRVIHQDRSRNNVQLSRSVFFKVNSDVINAEGLEAVRNVADFVINDPRALVLVYGYASIDGPVDFNNKLAAKRAASVIKALQEAGVPAAAIKRYDNGVDTTPAKRTDARRVDMDVIY
ncbi:OmpA family protein [uncultured Porphyromonas sp.]|uniref:OmpA family protein n=1 Tax=uncultured Porphyromonas sp. TaxID=159274 RepID=UPI0026341A9A|nr:OmpA family protein [uncultured Porphyromonas sp.]